jgi:hypothetical protein
MSGVPFVLFTPGALVRHPLHPDWGLGQVQSNIDGRLTVNFQNAGKMVLTGQAANLALVFDA